MPLIQLASYYYSIEASVPLSQLLAVSRTTINMYVILQLHRGCFRCSYMFIKYGKLCKRILWEDTTVPDLVRAANSTNLPIAAEFKFSIQTHTQVSHSSPSALIADGFDILA